MKEFIEVWLFYEYCIPTVIYNILFYEFRPLSDKKDHLHINSFISTSNQMLQHFKDSNIDKQFKKGVCVYSTHIMEWSMY